ncbi:MAG: hypothetical protein ACU841_08985 [Gammaproteobacteria bacterium]
MLEIPGTMQAALVSHYGGKTGILRDLIRSCQDKLSELLLSSFHPYELEQVHGTVIGLEGWRVDDQIMNQSYQRYRNEKRFMSPQRLLELLRSGELPSFDIRVGGYRPHQDYGFLSQNKHPFLRSFSIQNQIAVAMGWPCNGNRCSEALNELRYRFNELNVLHRWHRSPGAIDNDFYFVLGRIDRRFLSDARIQRAEEAMRLFLSERSEMYVPIDPSVLSIVGYLDTQLPLQTSCSFQVFDSNLDAQKLLGLYPAYETRT